MRRAERLVALAVCGLISGAVVAAQGPDPETVDAIKDEGLHRSQAVELAGWLSDVYGPRLTGSPNLENAGRWATCARNASPSVAAGRSESSTPTWSSHR